VIGYDDHLDSLDGKTVIGLDVSDREESIRFRCADGSAVVWSTEGDCCSESWWADATGLDQLRGATVRGVRELELPDPEDDGRTRQESDVVYGYAIDTDAGSATLAFRNSSNGYYGGSAGLGRNRDWHNWRELTGSEWSA
jgi:hypothetical protein